MTTYAVTGATGKLGRLVLDELLEQTDATNIVALARDPSALQAYDQKGVQVRKADYDDPASLTAALQGVDRVLLISGNAVGQRERQHGAIYGAAGEGKLSTATRADLAAGAVGALLKSPGGRTYELAGNHPWTMQEFAEEVSRQAGKPVQYVNQSESDYAKTLEGAGLPQPVATLLASTSYLAGHGELYSESTDLRDLAGRPSTPIGETIAQALKA